MIKKTNMPTWIIISLIVVTIIGLAVSGYVISLNLSSKILYSTFSILGLGLLSLVITTFSILKEENTETRFLTTILVSSANNLPFSITYTGTENFIERHDEIGIISSYLLKDPNYKMDSTNSNRNLCKASLQYQIIKKILDLNNNTTRVQQHNDKLKLTSRNSIVPKDICECSVKSKKELTKIDRYIASPKKILAFMPLALPEGAEIKVDNSTNDYKIIIEKKNYFKFQVVIKVLSRSQENTSVYKELISEFPKINNYYSVILEVKINSHFEKLTSESNKTKEYKEWLKYLSHEIEEYFSDSNKTENY
jgi:hypothetical protein